MKKNVILVLLAVATVSLGILSAQEKSRLDRMSARLAELEVRDSQQLRQLQAEQKSVTELTQEKTRLVAKADARKQQKIAAQEKADAALAAESTKASLPPTPPPAAAAVADNPADTGTGSKLPKTSGTMKDYVNSMMKDPAMRKMMRSTQGAGLKQVYGDLVKQWNLSPDDATAFYDLLLDRQMANIDQGTALLANNGQETAPSAAPVDQDAALKASLGDAMYQQYKDYEKAAPDHMALSMYKQRLATDDVQSLTQDQSAYLMRVMAEERQNLAAQDAASIQNTVTAKGVGNPALMDGMLKSQAQLNDRVNQRLTGMLTPQQLDSFKQYQKQMLDMMTMGAQMAAKMGNGNP